MADACRTRSGTVYSPHSLAALLPSSPPSFNHSHDQFRDSGGRLASGSRTRTTPATRSQNALALVAAQVVPDITTGSTARNHGVNLTPAAAAPLSHTEPPVLVPDHKNVFIINEKCALHCTFSHDSDEETGDWPVPRKKEIKRTGEKLRVWLKRSYSWDDEAAPISDHPSDDSIFSSNSSE